MHPTLIVLAAGMGSRYGGIKQIEGVGPNNESLIDYSIYNALKANFKKIVMVIRKEIQKDIEDFFQGKIPSDVPLEFVFQELEDIPHGYNVPPHRKKPWGTGQAVLCCKDVVHEPFAMINGDDYYSYEALQEVSRFLSSSNVESSDYAIVGYELKQTLSPHGSVSRGICQVDTQGNLISLEENKKIIIAEQGAIISEHDEDATKNKTLTGKEPVSMNLFGFTPKFFTQLEDGFKKFLDKEGMEEKSEFFVPSHLGELVQKNQATARVLNTNAQWFGITYQADKQKVEEALKKLVSSGNYPSPLW